jgi:hypothetical protein
MTLGKCSGAAPETQPQETHPDLKLAISAVNVLRTRVSAAAREMGKHLR